MRPIKFRCWDGKEMRQVFCNEIQSCFDEEFNIQEGYDVMQFTGLLDKNGKEIYENDIVTVTDSGEEYLVGNYMVKANSAGYYLNRKSQYWWLGEPEHFSITHPSEFEWQIGNIEVIGNIYENPELLTNTYGK